MRVTRLEAQDVHGYLSISVDFFDDLTFLTGLNGSGKTSALRLLMALLTPNVEELSTAVFSTVAVTIKDGSNDLVIRAVRSTEGIELHVTGVEGHLSISTAEMQLLTDPHTTREESRSPVQEKAMSHPVFRTIAALSTPMFLGLDRRFSTAAFAEDPNEARRREFVARRLRGDEPGFRGAGAVGLADLHYLVLVRMQEIRASQEKIDQEFRNRILTRAFEYKPSDIGDLRRPPSGNELRRYRERLAFIERAAENLKLPVPELKTSLSDFFERMGKVVEGLEQNASAERADEDADDKRDLVDWIINKPQAERILEHLQLLDEYGSQRAELHAPMDRFLSLVNEFLIQTGKEIRVNPRGELGVVLNPDSTSRPITSLSSGERQLLVMLGHLSLNRSLVDSSVFIVDEPELSLHVGWQERFVDAIQAANPHVQLIMATHSPAIILDRDDHCRALVGAA